MLNNVGGISVSKDTNLLDLFGLQIGNIGGKWRYFLGGHNPICLVSIPSSSTTTTNFSSFTGWARVSFVRDAPDGRRFANDQRGFLYRLDGDAEPSIYADFAAAFPHTIYNRLESGFIGFGFHPEFAQNGLFYTVHGERAFASLRTPDFIPPGYTEADVTHHNVITEWRADDPMADTFAGTRRELLRVAHVTTNMSHPFGYVGFNPTSEPV